MSGLTSDTLANLYLKQGHARQALTTLETLQANAPDTTRAARIASLEARFEQPRLRRLEELLARIRESRER